MKLKKFANKKFVIYLRRRKKPKKKRYKKERVLRVATLNIGHGRGVYPHQIFLTKEKVAKNLSRIAYELQRQSIDIIALQEADGPSIWSGNFNHIVSLASLGGNYNCYYGLHNPFKLGKIRVSSGAAILSSYPLYNCESVRFATSWKDTKGFVIATISIPQWGYKLVDIVSLHLAPWSSKLREKQTELLIEFLNKKRSVKNKHPLIVMGDLNCEYDAKELKLLTKELNLKCYSSGKATFPIHMPFRRIDWILISKELVFSCYLTNPTPLADHLMVTADIIIPKPFLKQAKETRGHYIERSSHGQRNR